MKKKSEKVITFFGKDAEFEGKLTFCGALRIDGHFKGEIVADGSLFVGVNGKVEADLHVRRLIVCGEVHGNIIADEKIEICSPGKVYGNIQTPSMVIDEGVIFEGNCKMHPESDTKEGLSAQAGSDQPEIGILPFISSLDSSEDQISKAN